MMNQYATGLITDNMRMYVIWKPLKSRRRTDLVVKTIINTDLIVFK